MIFGDEQMDDEYRLQSKRFNRILKKYLEKVKVYGFFLFFLFFESVCVCLCRDGVLGVQGCILVLNYSNSYFFIFFLFGGIVLRSYLGWILIQFVIQVSFEFIFFSFYFYKSWGYRFLSIDLSMGFDL